MNTLILVTQNNLEEITAFSRELGEKQKLSNTGKLLISGGYYLDDNILRDIGNPISKSFEVTELTKVQVSPDLDNGSQLATMFATFFMQRYTTVPGPWLIIDSRFEINRDNPISLMEKLHNEARQENSGRATTSGGGRVPVGPVVIGAEVQRLSTLRSVSGENWRSRGRWIFNVCSWNQISSEDYPFRVPAIEPSEEAKSGDKEGNLAPGETEVVEITENIRSNNLPISNYVPPVKTEEKPFDGFTKVEMSEEASPLASEEIVDNPVPETPVPGKTDNSHIPKPFILIEPDVYDSVSREILIEQVHKRTGRKPHPRTGSPKLIKALQELDLEKIQE